MHTLQFSNQNDLLRDSSRDPVEGIFPISSSHKTQICVRRKDKIVGYQYSPSTGTWDYIWEEVIYGPQSTYSSEHYPWLISNKVLPEEELILFHHPDGVKIYKINQAQPGLSFVKKDSHFMEPYRHNSSIWGYFYPKNNELGLISAIPGDIKLYAITPDSFSHDVNYPLFSFKSADIPSFWNDSEFFIAKIRNDDQDYICLRNEQGMKCYSFNENYRLNSALESPILAKSVGSTKDVDRVFFANLTQRKNKEIIHVNSSGLFVYVYNANKTEYELHQRTELSVSLPRPNDLIRLFDVNNDGRDDLIFTGSKGLSAISYDFNLNSWISLIEPEKLDGFRRYAAIVGTLPPNKKSELPPSIFIQDSKGRLQWAKVASNIKPRVATTALPQQTTPKSEEMAEIEVARIPEKTSRIEPEEKPMLRLAEQIDSSFLKNTVDTGTGQVNLEIPLIDLSDTTGWRIQFSLSYDSASQSSDIVGEGWHFPLMQDFIFVDHQSSINPHDYIYYFITQGQNLPLKFVEEENGVKRFELPDVDDVEIKYIESEEQWIVEGDAEKVVFGSAKETKCVLWGMTWPHWRGVGKNEAELRSIAVAWYANARFDKLKERTMYYEYEDDRATVSNGNFYTTSLWLRRMRDDSSLTLNFRYSRKASDEFEAFKLRDDEGYITFPKLPSKSHYLTGYSVTTTAYRQNVEFTFRMENEKRLLNGIQQQFESHSEPLLQFSYISSLGRYFLSECNFAPTGLKAHYSYESLKPLNFDISSDYIAIPINRRPAITYSEAYAILAFNGTGNEIVLRITNKKLTSIIHDCSIDDITCPSTDSKLLDFGVKAYRDSFVVVLQSERNRLLYFYHRTEKNWLPSPTVHSFGKDAIIRFSETLCVVGEPDASSIRIFRYNDDETTKWKSTNLQTYGETFSLATHKDMIAVHGKNTFMELFYTNDGLKWYKKNLGTYECCSNVLDKFDVEDKARSQIANSLKEHSLQIHNNLIVTSVIKESYHARLMIAANLILLDASKNVVQKETVSISRQNLLDITNTGTVGGTTFTRKYVEDGGKYKIRTTDISGKLVDDRIAGLRKNVNIIKDAKDEIIKEDNDANSNGIFRQILLIDPGQYSVLVTPQGVLFGNDVIFRNTGTRWERDSLPDDKISRLGNHFVLETLESVKSSAEIYRQDKNHEKVGRPIVKLPLLSKSSILNRYPYYIAYSDEPNSLNILTFKDEKTLGDQYSLYNEELSPYSDFNALVTVSNSSLTLSSHAEPLELRVRPISAILSSSSSADRYVSQTEVSNGDIHRLTGYKRALRFNRQNYTLTEKMTVTPGHDKSRHGWYEVSRTLNLKKGDVEKSEQWFSANGLSVTPKKEAPNDDSDSSEKLADSLILDRSGQQLICDISPFKIADEMVEYHGFESYESGKIGKSTKRWEVHEGQIINSEFSFTGNSFLELKKHKSYVQGVLHPRDQQMNYLAASWIRVPSTLEINATVNYFKVIVTTSTGREIIGLRSQVKLRSGEWYYLELPIRFSIIRQIYKEFLDANKDHSLPSENAVQFTLTLRAENADGPSLHIDHIRLSPLSHDFQINVHHPVTFAITNVLYTNGQLTRYFHNRLKQPIAEIQEPDNFIRFTSHSNTGRSSRPLQGNHFTPLPSTVTLNPDHGIYESFDAIAWRSRWTVLNPDSWKRAPGQLLHQTSSKDTLTPKANLFDPDHSALRCYVSLQSKGSVIKVSWGDSIGFQLTRRDNDAILTVIGGRSFSPLPSSGEVIILLDGIYIAVWFDGILLLDQALVSTGTTSSSLWSKFSIEAQKLVLFEDCMLMNRPGLSVKYENSWNDETQIIEHVGINSVLVSETLYDDVGRGAITTKATYMSRVSSGPLFSYRSDFVGNANPRDEQSVWHVGKMKGSVDASNPNDNGLPYTRNDYELDPLDEKSAVGLPGANFAIGGRFATKMSRDSRIDFLYNIFPPEQGYRQHVVAKPNGSLFVSIFDKRNNQVGKYVRVPNYNHILSTYEYDEKNRLIKILPPLYHDKAGSEWKYSPWQPGEGHLSENEHFWQKSQATLFTFDDFGNIIRKRTPDGGVTDYLYNSQGQQRFMVSQTSDNEVNQVVYYDYNNNGQLQRTGYLQSPIDLEELRGYVDSVVLPDSVIYQQFDYADEHSEPLLRGRIKQYITNNNGVIILEKLAFNDREQITEKRVIVAETSATDSMSDLQKSYVNGKLHSLTYPINHKGQSLQLIHRYNRQDQLVALEDKNNQVFTQFTYNAEGQITSESYEPTASNGFIRNFYYNSPGYLERISDPFLTESIAYTEGGYGEMGYGDGIVMRTAFNASWSTSSDYRRFRITEEDLDSKFSAVCIRALKRTGHLNHDGRPLKLFHRRAETSMPIVCGGQTERRIVEKISEKLNPEFQGHRYAYGVHQELIRAKYFTNEFDVEPLQPNTFSKEISHLTAQQSEDIWELLCKGDFIYKDQPRNDLSTAVGKPGKSFFRRSELRKDLATLNSDYIVFVSSIEKLVINAIAKRKVISLSDFIEVYLNWQGLDLTSSILTINWHKEKAEKIGNMLVEKSYLPVSSSNLTAPLHNSFTSTLNEYRNVLPEIINVLTNHFEHSLGESAFDVESFKIDANGNHELFYTGLNRFELSYRNGTNQIDKIKFNFPQYLKPAEVFSMKHDNQGNIIQALHKKIQRIEYHPVSQRTTYMQLEDGRVLRFYYDAQGERSLKRVVGDDGRVMSEVYYLRDEKGRVLLDKSVVYSPTKTKTLVTAYIYGPRGLIGFFRKNNFYSVTTDHLGSIRLIIQAGSVVAAYDYLPFGELMRTYCSDPDGEIRYRFTGQEFDEETGLYNFHARLYDPSIGRFYQMDPKAQYFSPYKYAGNSPVSLVDPDGELAFLAIAMIVSSIVLAAGGAYLGGAAANNRWNPADWDWKDHGTYLGMFGGAVAGGLTPIGFSASAAAMGTYGVYITIGLGAAGTYFSAAASQGTFDLTKWDIKRPDLWNAMFQGFSTGSGFVGGFSSVHKFANVGKALAAGDKVMFGKALLSLSKRFGWDINTLGRGFLALSYGAGVGVALIHGAQANDGNFAFWAWDWKNPATIFALIDGIDTGSGWLQNTMELGRGLSKLTKSHKALTASLKGMGSMKALQKILKNHRHPLFKTTSSVVMAYFMGSSATGEIDITKWSMSSFSTYEGIINGIFFGKDVKNLLKLARGLAVEKSIDSAGNSQIARIPDVKVGHSLSEVPKYRTFIAYRKLISTYFSSDIALKGLLRRIRGDTSSVVDFFKKGFEKWKSGESRPPEVLDRIITENANKIAHSDSTALAKWSAESAEQSRKQFEVFPDNDAPFLNCRSLRRKKRSGQGGCIVPPNESVKRELTDLPDDSHGSVKAELTYLLLNNDISDKVTDNYREITPSDLRNPIGYDEHLSLVLKKTPTFLAAAESDFFPNFFLGSLLTMEKSDSVRVNAKWKKFSKGEKRKGLVTDQEFLVTSFYKKQEGVLSFNVFVTENRLLKYFSKEKKDQHKLDVTKLIIEDIHKIVNGDSIEKAEIDPSKITASIFYIDPSNTLSVRHFDRASIENTENRMEELKDFGPETEKQIGIYDFSQDNISHIKKMDEHLQKISSDDEQDAKEGASGVFNSLLEIYTKNQKIFGFDLTGESGFHGFAYGALTNNKYKFDLDIAVERISGRGYADMIILSRKGMKGMKNWKSFPIIIEFKADKTTSASATNQVSGSGYYYNLGMRTVAKKAIVVGLNSYTKTVDVSAIDIPRPDSIVRQLLTYERFSDTETFKKKVETELQHLYYSISPLAIKTPQDANNNYLSRLILGQMISQRDVYTLMQDGVTTLLFKGSDPDSRWVMLNIVESSKTDKDKNIIFNPVDGRKLQLPLQILPEGETIEKLVKVDVNINSRSKDGWSSEIKKRTVDKNDNVKDSQYFFQSIDVSELGIPQTRGNNMGEFPEYQRIGAHNNDQGTFFPPGRGHADIGKKSNAETAKDTESNKITSKINGKLDELNLGNLINSESDFQAVIQGWYLGIPPRTESDGTTITVKVFPESNPSSEGRIDIVALKLIEKKNEVKTEDMTIMELKYIDEDKKVSTKLEEADKQVRKYVKNNLKTFTDSKSVIAIAAVYSKQSDTVTFRTIKDKNGDLSIPHTSAYPSPNLGPSTSSVLGEMVSKRLRIDFNELSLSDIGPSVRQERFVDFDESPILSDADHSVREERSIDFDESPILPDIDLPVREERFFDFDELPTLPDQDRSAREKRSIDFDNDYPYLNQSWNARVQDAEKPYSQTNDYYVASSGSSTMQFWPVRLLQNIVSSFSKCISSWKYDTKHSNEEFITYAPVNDNKIDPFDREIVLEMGDSFLKHADVNGLLTWGVVLARKWTGFHPKNYIFANDSEVNVRAMVLSTAFVVKFVESSLDHALSCGIKPVVSRILKQDNLLSEIVGKITGKAENCESQVIARILYNEVIVRNIDEIAVKTTKKQSDRFARKILANMTDICQQLSEIRKKSFGEVQRPSPLISQLSNKFNETVAYQNLAEMNYWAEQCESKAAIMGPKLN